LCAYAGRKQYSHLNTCCHKPYTNIYAFTVYENGLLCRIIPTTNMRASFFHTCNIRIIPVRLFTFSFSSPLSNFIFCQISFSIPYNIYTYIYFCFAIYSILFHRTYYIRIPYILLLFTTVPYSVTIYVLLTRRRRAVRNILEKYNTHIHIYIYICTGWVIRLKRCSVFIFTLCSIYLTYHYH